AGACTPSGATRSRSRPTSSPWWRANWTCWRTGSDRGGRDAVSAPAVQRKPGRVRRARGRAHVRRLARPVPEAVLPLRLGGGRTGRAGGPV
ncbi:hypothetical protein CQA20_29270, partial [Klebsiella pneumoniae]